MANGNGAAAIIGKLWRAEAKLAAEGHKHRHAERQLAGTRSAVRKLQVLLARQKAAEAERRAEGA
jgi:hypothetical protein